MDKPKSGLLFTMTTKDVKGHGDQKYSAHIEATASGRPAKRLTLTPYDVKIISAKITRAHKNKSFDYQIKRINRLPTLQQTRLHADTLLYPGQYQIDLEVSGDQLSVDKLSVS
jgi:hypothetical protein